jgi:hypothetical protein
MFENNLDVIRETQKFRYEDALNIRRGYYYPVERFARGHTVSVWTRIQLILSPLVELLQVPRPSYRQTECVLSMVVAC